MGKGLDFYTILQGSFIAQMYSVVEKEEGIVKTIMRNRFGVDTNDLDAVKEVIKQKRLMIIRDGDFNILGISANNRWLYTPSGQVIGKEGGRYRIENIR